MRKRVMLIAIMLTVLIVTSCEYPGDTVIGLKNQDKIEIGSDKGYEGIKIVQGKVTDKYTDANSKLVEPEEVIILGGERVVVKDMGTYYGVVEGNKYVAIVGAEGELIDIVEKTEEEVDDEKTGDIITREFTQNDKWDSYELLKEYKIGDNMGITGNVELRSLDTDDGKKWAILTEIDGNKYVMIDKIKETGELDFEVYLQDNKFVINVIETEREAFIMRTYEYDDFEGIFIVYRRYNAPGNIKVYESERGD